MARPRADDYADKLAAFEDKAAELFAARGFAGASIGDIAAACGVSKALLYHYFASKEDLLYRLLAAHMQALQAAASRALAAAGAPERRLRALVLEFMRVYARSQAKHALLVSELEALPAARRRAIVAAERRLIEQVVALLGEINPQAMAATERRWPYAMLFYGMINWTYIWYRAGGAVAPEAFARMAADLFLDGFSPASGRAAPAPR